MKYYAQIFRDEIIYAGIYETCKKEKYADYVETINK